MRGQIALVGGLTMKRLMTLAAATAALAGVQAVGASPAEAGSRWCGPGYAYHVYYAPPCCCCQRYYVVPYYWKSSQYWPARPRDPRWFRRTY
jgi:hypothetical protein